MAKTRTVVDQPDPPIERHILAEAIVKVSTAATTLAASGLNRRAIVVLLAESTKLPKRTVDCVLDGLEALRADYCR